MEWYNILFLVCLSIFVIKTIITLFFGDLDIDFDFDGDVDFDVSSMVSFKGVLHFLLGFSSYIVAITRLNVTNSDFSLSWYHYLGAVITGIILMIILYFSYKLMMKLNHYNDTKQDLNNYNCSILNTNGNIGDNTFSYTVLVNTESGSQKINVVSNKSNLKVGSTHKIQKNEQGIYFI